MMSEPGKGSQEGRAGGADEGDGLLGRLARRFRRSAPVRVPTVDDEDLTVRVRCDDDTRASSTVLGEADFSSTDPVVLRQLVFVPAAKVTEVAAGAALDCYEEVQRLDADPEPPADLVALPLARVMTVDARSLSQERSRMASLASRCDGHAVGWSLLTPPAE